MPDIASKPHRKVLSAATLANDRVTNPSGEDLARVEEIMLDITSGSVAYVVVSFGGFLGMGEKLFAIPWKAFRIDEDTRHFVLDADKRQLESAPGFDKDNWPDFADPVIGAAVHQHYNRTPYWEHAVTDAGDYVGDGRQPNRDMEIDPATGYRAVGK